MVRKVFHEFSQTRQGRHRAFDVGIVDHDVTKDFAGIQLLVPTPPTIVFVSRPSSVFVLICQQDVCGLVKTLIRNWCDLFTIFQPILDGFRLEQTQRSLQTLSRAITDGPTVGRSRKRPATLGNMAIRLETILVCLECVRGT